jgi:hypothetical protein
MSEYPFRNLPRRSQPRRGRRIALVLVGLVALGGVFVLGIALGKALNDGPSGGTTVTYVRTLEPLPQQPAEAR